MSADRTWSLTSPRVVFPTLAAALVLAALLRPADTREDSRLTTYSAAPNGAKAMFDVAARLGWHPVRRDRQFAGRLDTAATYLVLAPVRAVSPEETHVLLDAVRAGAGLVLAVSEDESSTRSLADSLRLNVVGLGYHLLDGGSADRAVPTPADSEENDGRGNGRDCGRTRGIGNDFVRRMFVLRGAKVEGVDTLLGAKFGEETRPTAIARPFGHGRVVAIADPDLLRNDVLRLCGTAQAAQRPGVRMVRLLEAAAPNGGALVFDEWHQGYGRQPEDVDALSYALGRTGWGRAVGAGIVAALLWLWAAGARVLVPVERTRAERRSPLEHVGALARAYEQVAATRTAVRRMVRGLRRRHPAAARRGSDDRAFLDAIASQRPELASAVALVQRGADDQLSPAELVLVGDAVETIDAALGRPAPDLPRSARVRA